MRLFLFLLPIALLAKEDEVVFRSDVALARVDAQVLDRSNHAITGLNVEDFVLAVGGEAQQIRNFVREEMPVDVLFLIDVSGSMRPNVERLASASQQALYVLGGDDRVAIMVFDRATRLRMPLRRNGDAIGREFDALLHQESFDGGTDITRALLDAAAYMRNNGRSGARRAIVILTDDQTERERDEERVASTLNRADTVLSALLAPDAMRQVYRSGGGGYPGGGPLGGGWPDIIIGRRAPGGGYPGGGTGRARTRSAGTAEIARQSGGDSMPVDHASALETTLMRLRQRYALHYNASESAAGQVDVRLADGARRRYPGAEVRYRRINQSGASSTAEPVQVSQGWPASTAPERERDSETPRLKRRPISEPSTQRGPNPSLGEGGWPKAGDAVKPEAAQPAAPPAEPQPQTGGWRRVKPGEQP
ncbi:MAG: VWA domain-containing protein [Bryobacteraceae bacterium]|nr:VWA domain-containing protein [Bryobacteraceae bacterium]